MAVSARSNKGFSLIELLIAMTLIMVSMLALLTSMLTTINANRNNEIRNTAIMVANQTAEALLALPIDDGELSMTPTASHSRTAGNAAQRDKGFPEVNQRVRGFNFNYEIKWTVDEKSANLKQVGIEVKYKLKETDPDDKKITYSSVIYKHRAI